MFTGIIEGVGCIKQIREQSGKRYPTIATRVVTEGLRLGDSIACDGICVTVTGFTATDVTVEVMRETLLKSTAAHWQPGRKVNLERACRLDSRLDGHIVQGHIDTVARVLNSRTIEGTRYLECELPVAYRAHVVAHGSIAVNGVSLTVAELTSSTFVIALIGFTGLHTNLEQTRAGEEVNLEFDILGKYILRKLEVENSGLSEIKLKELGF